jgi:hypothetical protein
MNADLTTVLVAILGVAGTLTSPLLVQWIAARAKRQEFELQHQERFEERAEAQRRRVFEERRSMYAGLNTAARQYTQELRAYLRMIAANAVNDEGRADLSKARQTYRDLYSDAQMILPDHVLDAAASVSEGLGQAYGMVKRLETGEPSAETIDIAQEYCRVTLYDLIIEVRQLMREDLGVSDPRP